VQLGVVFVFCSESEMNNPYRQFTVQPRPNARFRASARGSNFNNSNFHNPALGTVRLLSPAVAHANQQMYGALHSNTPVIATDGTAGYSAVGQAAFSPMYMMNCHPGMAVVPVIPIEFGNQRSGVRHPANFPDVADLLGQCVTENAAVFQNHMPALQPQAVSVRPAHNMRSLPRVPMTACKVENAASLLSNDVQIPFRQVQWVPPAVQETGVPQIPYAVEIKPQIGGTPQNCVPSGNFSMTNSAVPVNDASCGAESGNDWSVPTVYLDIATDSGSHCFDANTRTAGASSVIGDVAVVNAASKRGRRKRVQCESYSGIKVLKVCSEDTVKHGAVSVAPLDSTVVPHHYPESCDGAEEFGVADDEELNQPEVDSHPVLVQEQERPSNQGTSSPSALSAASEPGELIRSDEDVGGAPHDDDTCVPDDDVDSDRLECYEVMPTNSDALLFDMECDGETDGETLRVIVPTKSVKTAAAETAVSLPKTPKNAKTVSAKTAAPLLKTHGGVKTASAKTIMPRPTTAESERLQKLPTASHSGVVQINLSDDDPDIVIVEPKRRARAPVTRSQRLAARAQIMLQAVQIRKSENSLLGVPLQCSFFRFETQSSEVFRLLSMEKSVVPHNMLTDLSDLVSSANATTDDNQCASSDFTNGAFGSIPCGGSRKLLFQCLFCPYGELSAKRVMGHVKQQHKTYATFLQRSLLPNCQTLLYIYCRHCNFITYDSAALFIHFASYHKVAGILLSAPKVIESDPTWEPVVNPEAKAREFPFFCCPDCGYVDVERNRIAQHMLEKQSSESVFFGCVVRLIMVVRGSKPLGSLTYASLTTEENHTMYRKEIYACVGCKFFSFYPTYAFSHYVTTHSCFEMLYVCAASPSCTKRCTTRDDIISHIQAVHVAMKSLRFQCTATLLDSVTSAQLDISPGGLTAADVPVHLQYRSPSSASDSTNLEETIEIVDDDDDDSDDDIVVLGSPPKDRKTSVDVEPDSPVTEERSACANVPVNSEPSSACAAAEQGVTDQKESELCFGSTERRLTETVTEHCEGENVEPDVMQSVENGTLSVTASGAVPDTTDSVCRSEDQAAAELDNGRNSRADLSSHVEDESLQLVECDLQSNRTEEKQTTAESHSVENTINTNTPGTSHAELVDSPLDTSLPSKDTNPLAGSNAVVTEMENDISLPSSDESSTILQSLQRIVEEISHKESVDCVECSVSSSKNADQLVDVSSSVSHVDESCTESESAENPFPGDSPVESVDCVEESSFLNDKNQLPQSATADSSSVSGGGSIPASLEIHQSDDLQGECDRNVSEDEVTSTQLNSACTAEQEMCAFDRANEVSLLDCLLDEDSLPSFELCKSPCDRLESSECFSLDLEEEVLVLPGQLTTDEPQHCDEAEHAVAACSVVSEAESVADDSCIVSTENPCLGPYRESSDDTFCSGAVENEQLHTPANLWSPEADVIDNSLREDFAETSVPSCADCSCRKRSESGGSEVNAQTDSVSEQGNDSDIADRPVSRFKFLAGFRFPAPHPFKSNPS